MVDLQCTNKKLRDRSARIFCAATGADSETAAARLEQAGGTLKTAILMELAGIDRAEAEARLERSGGRLKQAAQG